MWCDNNKCNHFYIGQGELQYYVLMNKMQLLTKTPAAKPNKRQVEDANERKTLPRDKQESHSKCIYCGVKAAALNSLAEAVRPY